MTFIKTSLLSGLATFVSMILGLVLNKVLAVYIGPAGLGLIGQFQSTLAVLKLWVTGGVAAGVVKYTAEFRENTEQKHAFWSMGIRISLFLTCVCSATLFIFSSQLSLWVLKSIEYSFVFELLAFIVFFFIWNQFLLSVLNGQKEIKRLLLINVISSIIKLVLVCGLGVLYEVKGALLGFILMEFFIFIVSLYLVSNLSWFSFKAFFGPYDTVKVKMLLGFTLMAILGGVTGPVSQLIVRDFIGGNISWDAAGQVQALWQLSAAFLAVLGTVLSIYLLPKLSEIKQKCLLRKEVFFAFKLVFPLLLISSAFVVFFKREVILLMYSESFLPVLDLFFYQFVGNLMKGIALLFSFLMLSKAMIKLFIATQLIFATSYIFLSILFVDSSGLIGVAQAYALNYTFYLATVVFIFMNYTKE